MVCGTASGVGKSFIVAALCRLLARRGLRVAPFKAQNMSNNASVGHDGAEMGRAQYAQALAAGVSPEGAMNPVLLKPGAGPGCRVVVLGREVDDAAACDWAERAPELRPVVLGALADLRRRFDLVVVEGAGGAAEINILHRDIANLPLARAAGIPAVIVGDIERGGVFASLYGTVALMPPGLRARVTGMIVNRFRGDPRLLDPGIAALEDRTGLPVLGVIPWLDGIGLDHEDALDLGSGWRRSMAPGALDVAVVDLPHLANASDLDPLVAEAGVGLRLVDGPGALGAPDLVILCGSTSTVADLEWLRQQELAEAVTASHAAGAAVLGICGGYQMLGHAITDDVESRRGRVDGLGLLDVDTVFGAAKVVRRRRGWIERCPVEGYEIRHGRPARRTGAAGWLDLRDEHGRDSEGAISADRGVMGTSLHGIFEADAFRRRFLSRLAQRRGATIDPSQRPYAEARIARFDRMADLIERHLDITALLRQMPTETVRICRTD